MNRKYLQKNYVYGLYTIIEGSTDLSLRRYCMQKLKGLVKLGNIVAETMFLVMFPGVAKLGNMAKFVSGKQKCF